MIQAFHHVCIETDRYSESIEFYCGLLGCMILHETKGFHGREYTTWLKLNDSIIELQTPKAGYENVNHEDNEMGIRHMCFVVNDLGEMVEELKNKGYRNFKENDGK